MSPPVAVVEDENDNDPGDNVDADDEFKPLKGEVAKEKEYKYIFTSLKSDPLIKRYEACGFVKGSQGCTELIKKL